MGASSPSWSREPRNAVTKLKDRTSAARMRRSGLRGTRQLWVDANLNAQNSRNMLRCKWLGRAPHQSHTTKTRGSTSPLVRMVSPLNAEEPTIHQRQYKEQLHGDTDRVGRSCKSDHDQRQAGYSCCQKGSGASINLKLPSMIVCQREGFPHAAGRRRMAPTHQMSCGCASPGYRAKHSRYLFEICSSTEICDRTSSST